LRTARLLSAGLLCLPAPMALAQAGWECRQGPQGWVCGASATTAQPASQPARKPLTEAINAANGAAPAPTRTTLTPPAAQTPATPAEPPSSAATQIGAIPAEPMLPAEAQASQSVAPPAAAAVAANEWDWVPADRLPAGDPACCSVGRGCDGAYVEPVRDWPDAERQPEGAALRASSGSSQWQGDQVALQDQVVLTQGNLRLSASDGEFDRKTQRARLKGGVLIRQPGVMLRGASAEVDTTTGLGEIHDARYLDYSSGARARADKLARTAPQIIELKRARYTQCPPDEESWRLDANTIRLNRDSGRGVATNTVLRVADIPVFYSPYLNFPIDDRRQTGFLWPSVGTSGDGLDLALPLYLNLAPNYDATLTPRHITERGTLLEAEARYLSPGTEWKLLGASLRNDRVSDDDRWLLGLDQRGRFDSGLSSFIDYRKVSDNDYLSDFSLTSLDVRRQTHLTQQAGIGYALGRWRAGLNLVQYQTIDDLIAEPYRKLPQLTLERVATRASFALDYQFNGEAVRFDNRDSFSDGGSFVTGDRYYAEPGLLFPMRWAAGYITPELRLRHVAYDLDSSSPGAARTPSATVPLGIIDGGLFFERDTTWGDGDFRQTLEPRLYYLNSGYEAQDDQPNFDTSPLTFTYQQLFNPRRYSGRDRLEDFNQLTVGLTTRYIESGNGRELFNASLGQIHYFEDRRVTLSGGATGEESSSNVAAQFNLTPSDPVWSSINLLWDPDEDQMQQGSAILHVERDGGALYNIGYRYYRASNDVTTLNNGIDQVDLSAAWPLAKRWHLFARWNYDLDDNRSLEDLVGVEYEDCCWLVRVVYQNAVAAEQLDAATGIARAERDQAVLVEFQLKGLGSLGRKAGALLQESIWGYRERD
jgi:LPS-assembly protein